MKYTVGILLSINFEYKKILRNIVEEENAVAMKSNDNLVIEQVDHAFIIFFNLVQLGEKKVAVNEDVNLLFVDPTKAYDNVSIKKLWWVLQNIARELDTNCGYKTIT